MNNIQEKIRQLQKQMANGPVRVMECRSKCGQIAIVEDDFLPQDCDKCVKRSISNQVGLDAANKIEAAICAYYAHATPNHDEAKKAYDAEIAEALLCAQ